VKKLIFGVLVMINCACAYASSISIVNNLSVDTAIHKTIVLELDKIKADDSFWQYQVSNAATTGPIQPGENLFNKPLEPNFSVNYPWAYVGYKIYLTDSQGIDRKYLGYLGFTLHGNPTDEKGIVSGVAYSDVGADAMYQFTVVPQIAYHQVNNFEILGHLDVVPPLIITNKGWLSGMGNDYSDMVHGASFWTQDYGIGENGRWTVDADTQSIQQSTNKIAGYNVGSRAYPAILNTDGSYAPGVGAAFEGVWQVDIKIGSNGGGDISETFYLAERKNFAPGPNNYLDGSRVDADRVGREIDIMETRWQPNGPQVNLPNGGHSSWNPSAYINVKMGNWSDVGGAPTKDFQTFGAYIKGKNLWIYAYKADGTLWYSTSAIPLHSSYVQHGVFVPYIGAWGNIPGDFYTKYKNFIYLPSAKIPGNINPKDNPKEFLAAVHAAS